MKNWIRAGCSIRNLPSNGFAHQKLKCLLPNDVSLANRNRSGSVINNNT